MNKPTAHEVLNATMEDHAWKAEPLTLDSTDGIRRTLQAQGKAIAALADYIDGKLPDDMQVPVNGKDQPTDKRANK